MGREFDDRTAIIHMSGRQESGLIRVPSGSRPRGDPPLDRGTGPSL